MSLASEHFDAGMKMIDASLEAARAEVAAARSRVSRLQAAALLERAGDTENAQRVLDQVKLEQDAL